ncbi:MAG: TetR/AcrR family transcriptional regulator [Peptococcaceae bacterium]|nr:TetR/AcrR family transcriptional regulator [Candidatus Syntrophopropionicum ammoniitolerans]
MRRKKTDRRVKYTKMVLEKSFIRLLEKKDISQISITEICADADINRSTFYAHYQDQYDLLEKIQNELFANIEMHLAAYTQDGLPVLPVDMVVQIFEYIQENAQLCKLLLSEDGNLNFQKRVFMLVYEKMISDLTQKGTISKKDAEYIFAFTLTGCIGAIQKWLDEDMNKSPRFMAETIIKLTTLVLDGY